MSSFLNEVFGSKPKTYKWKPLDYSKEQGKSISGNIDNFGAITDLGNLYRDYFAKQQETLLPGYGESLAAGQKGVLGMLNLGNEFLTGELPDDVKQQVYRSGAYRALSGGYQGSGMSHAATARDLGLTSLDLMRQGAEMIGQGGNSAQRWAQLARGGIMDPSSQMSTPQQVSAFDMENQILRAQSKQHQFNVDAAPNPVAKGISDTIMSVIGAYLGGADLTSKYDSSNTFNSGNSFSANSSNDWFNNATGGRSMPGGI